MRLRLILWAVKHHGAALGLAKVIKGLKIKDGMFSYSSGRIFDPSKTKFTNNIKPDKTITITADDGRFNISGSIGGY